MSLAGSVPRGLAESFRNTLKLGRNTQAKLPLCLLSFPTEHVSKASSGRRGSWPQSSASSSTFCMRGRGSPLKMGTRLSLKGSLSRTLAITGHWLTITKTRSSWKDSKKRRHFRCEPWNTLACLTWMVTVIAGQDRHKRNDNIPAIAPYIPVTVKPHVLGGTRKARRLQGNKENPRRALGRPQGIPLSSFSRSVV